MLYLITGIIPLLFWVMDYRWRKQLLKCGMGKHIISAFINSPVFEKWVDVRQALPENEQFPLYDPVGWGYTRSNYPHGPYAENTWWRISV